MTIYLDCLFDPHRGRHLPVTAERAAVIKTQKSDQDVGEVRVELTDEGIVLTNHSRMICLVNGQQQRRQVLTDGDEITVGKQHFRLVSAAAAKAGPPRARPVVVDAGPDLEIPTRLSSGDDDTTQRIHHEPAETMVPCSACDGRFDPAVGWSRGDQRICRSCLGKGVQPEHLARPRSPPADSGRRPPPVRQAQPHAEIEVVLPASRSDDSQTATAPAPARPESDSDRQRRIRRISASQQTQVSATKTPGRPNLLQKVSQVFAQRDERRRLEVLEHERGELLAAAGRSALAETGGFGLTDGCLSPLFQGQAVTLRLQDLAIAAFEEWRTRKEHLAYLDAEIAAIRKLLGLGADPSLAAPPAANLRAERQVNQERTFQVLDGIGTEDIGKSIDPAQLPPPTSASDRAAAASGRRKAGRRRH